MAILSITSTALDFGDVAQGGTAQLSLTVRNNDDTYPITFGGIQPDDPIDFQVISAPAILVPKASGTIVVQFTAPAPAVVTATLTINCSAENTPIYVPLMGTAVAAGTQAISIDPPQIIFPTTKENVTSAPIAITITNTGTVSTTIHIPTVASPFASADLPVGDTVLTPGGTLVFHVTFTPTGQGYVADAQGVTITSTAPSSPDYVDLEGMGVFITPAYIVTGGTEGCYAGFGSPVYLFDPSTLAPEATTIGKRVWQFEPGMEDSLLRVEIQYEDRGVCALTITATNERGQTSFQTISIGTAGATGAIQNALADLDLQGELITLQFSPLGPLQLAAYIPRFIERGEVKKPPL